MSIEVYRLQVGMYTRMQNNDSRCYMETNNYLQIIHYKTNNESSYLRT